MEHIKQASEQEGLDFTKDIILQYAIARVKAHMKLSWLSNGVQSRSKNILIEDLKVKM